MKVLAIALVVVVWTPVFMSLLPLNNTSPGFRLW